MNKTLNDLTALPAADIAEMEANPTAPTEPTAEPIAQSPEHQRSGLTRSPLYQLCQTDTDTIRDVMTFRAGLEEADEGKGVAALTGAATLHLILTDAVKEGMVTPALAASAADLYSVNRSAIYMADAYIIALMAQGTTASTGSPDGAAFLAWYRVAKRMSSLANSASGLGWAFGANPKKPSSPAIDLKRSTDEKATAVNEYILALALAFARELRARFDGI